MPVHRSRLTLGGAFVLTALAAAGAGVAVAPVAASAPAPARALPASRSPGAAPADAHPHPAAPPTSFAAAGAADVGAADPGTSDAGERRVGVVRARAVARTRLTLAVRPRDGQLALTGALTRASNGARVLGRTVDVWTRTADTGRWHLEEQLRTSARGVVASVLADRPLLQVTLRFHGDAAYGAAASVTLVPEPGPARGLAPGLTAALARARAGARRAGLTLVLNSGYRTWAKQQRMYDAAVREYGSPAAARKWVLPPQESTHVRGLAVDLGTPAAAAWLTVHGAAYGLCRTYGDEPWHFEYRPDWVAAFSGRCPAAVPVPGDPDPLSPQPHVAVVF